MKKELVFYSILDFYPNRHKIKAMYKSLSLNDKKLYKNFVYSMIFTTEDVKDLIWEYLNDWEPSYEKLISEYIIKRRKQKDASVKDCIIDNNDNYVSY